MAEGGDSPKSPASARVALAGKSVEEIMTKLTSNSIAKNVSTLKRRVQAEDCLNAAEKTTQNSPKYAVRSLSPTQKGVSFGSAPKGFSYGDLPGNNSPGPCYASSSFTDHPNHPQSFPKAPRFENRGDESGPGPLYEVPGAIGRQLTRASAPCMRVGNGPRFTEAEYISAAHCKSMGGRGTPAPSTYNVTVQAPSSPKFSFASGGRDVKAGKLFISKAHAEREVGTDSPGPIYPKAHTYTRDGHPLFSALSPVRQHQRPSSLPPVQRSASPSSASPPAPLSPPPPTVLEFGKGKPAYTFGESDSSATKRFYSRELVTGAGMESPGPQYKPNERHITKSVPGCIFADPDPLIGSMMSRFADQEKYALGNASPGPANYVLPPPSSAGPAFTMARKDKALVKRICPGPERARFISKELAKDNMGAYSPGPKYKVPDTIGGPGSIKHSFGVSDRAFEDLSLEQREGMGFSAPCEARFISRSHSKAILGKFSPGPKYNPNLNVVLKRTPQASITGRWRDQPTPKLSKEELEEDRKRAKQRPPASKDITLPSQPKVKFGTSKRGLLGGEDKTKHFAGKDSPGPVYRPNFESIDRHRPNITFGSLR